MIWFRILWPSAILKCCDSHLQVHRKSSKKIGRGLTQLYAVLSTRAIYFFKTATDMEPDRYIRLEGLGVRRVRSKAGAAAFELYAVSAAARAVGDSKDCKDSVEGRMVKLSAGPGNAEGPLIRKTVRSMYHRKTCKIAPFQPLSGPEKIS